MQALPKNYISYWAQQFRAARPTMLVHLGCCALLLLLMVANLHRSLEACCFGMNTPQVAVHSSFDLSSATVESSRSQEQTPAPSMPIHCDICHTVSQITPFAVGFTILLILLAAILLPITRIPRCLLLAPTPPPPRVA